MTLSVALAIDLVTITNLPSRLTFWRKPPADATSVPRSLHDVRNRTNVPPYLFYGCSLHTDLTSPSYTEVGEERLLPCLGVRKRAGGCSTYVFIDTFSAPPSKRDTGSILPPTNKLASNSGSEDQARISVVRDIQDIHLSQISSTQRTEALKTELPFWSRY
ncbi:hypothetical protein LB504_004885 [Fusarium proliferatum]|nr:hypothetical protein LB504_004885 [Fusarium proliferatum]